MAKAKIVCEADYTHEAPATTLDTYHGDIKVSSINVPAVRTKYTAGQILEFRSAKDANAFIKAHIPFGGKFRFV